MLFKVSSMADGISNKGQINVTSQQWANDPRTRRGKRQGGWKVSLWIDSFNVGVVGDVVPRPLQKQSLKFFIIPGREKRLEKEKCVYFVWGRVEFQVKAAQCSRSRVRSEGRGRACGGIRAGVWDRDWWGCGGKAVFWTLFAQGMAQDKFGCSPGCLAIPRAAGPAECSALHLQSLGTTYPSAGRKGVVLTSSQPPGGSSTASKTAWFWPTCALQSLQKKIQSLYFRHDQQFHVACLVKPGMSLQLQETIWTLRAYMRGVRNSPVTHGIFCSLLSKET